MTLLGARPSADLAAALAAAPSGTLLTTSTLGVPARDPFGLVSAAVAARLEVAAWFRPSDGLAIVGVGRAWAIERSGPGRFADAAAAWTSVVADLSTHGRSGPAGPVLMGGLGFAADRPSESGPWSTFPTASLVLPALGYVEVGGRSWLTVTVQAGRERREGAALDATWARLGSVAANSPRPSSGTLSGPVRSTPDRLGWDRLVSLMAGAVGRGRLDKVVLARRVDLDLSSPVDAASTLRRLSDGAPESATYLFSRGGRAFMGVTPERLLRVEGRAFRTAAVAGSARRGRDPAEDARLAARLLASDKDREEHSVVVDALRRELEPIAADVRIQPVPAVLTLRDVHHLATPIEGVLREPAGTLDLAGRLHPTPAVGGAPRDAALTMIAELEGFERGWYAGPVGWVGADGDGELMVALRCGVVDGTHASLFAGCGIVADSDAGCEWDESRVKLRPMLSALGLDPDDTEAVP